MENRAREFRGSRTLKRKPAQIKELLERLELLYGRPRRIARFDPMDELVSCILSQSSSDANSFPAFTQLKETFPGWEDVAAADPAILVSVIRKAGLAKQKAKSIHACLQAIKSEAGEYSLEHLRRMPTLQARSWLMSLPGVGPKTASIVLCFAMGREAVPVDTHVFRVAKRLGLIPESVDEKRAHDLLLSAVPSKLAFRFHTDLIQHGRVTCRANAPMCSNCPLTEQCEWFKTGRLNSITRQKSAIRPKSVGTSRKVGQTN